MARQEGQTMNRYPFKNHVFVTIFAAALLAHVAVQADPPGGWNEREHRDGRWFYSGHFHPIGFELREMPSGFVRLLLNNMDYYYFEGVFYRPTPHGYVVVEAPVDAVVATVPTGCQPVVVEGASYYLINGTTYVATSAGYKVVVAPKTLVVQTTPAVVPAAPPAPVVEVAAPTAPIPVAVTVPAAPAAPVAVVVPTVASPANTYTVNIPNARGTYTPVVLIRSGNGFIGPQGEFYTDFPKVEQLKLMYGK